MCDSTVCIVCIDWFALRHILYKIKPPEFNYLWGSCLQMPHLRAYTAWFAFWRRGSAQVAACWCQDAAKHSVAPGFCSCDFWWHSVAWLLSYLARWFGLQLFLQCLGFGFTVKHNMLCLWWVPTSIHTYPQSWFLSLCSVLFLVGLYLWNSAAALA